MNEHQQYEARLHALIEQIGHAPVEELVRDFLAFDAEDGAPEELRSLATDAMLVAEGDLSGEFKSKEELLERFQELQRAS